MSPTDLALQGTAWLHAAFGLVAFLLPGAAAADRWLARVPARWVWSPVLSVTLLVLGAIALDLLGLRSVRPALTWGLALGLAAWLAWPRARTLLARVRLTTAAPPRSSTPRPWTWWGLGRRAVQVSAVALVLGFLFVAHSLPHLPGDSATDAPGVAHQVALRAKAAFGGNDDPYPVHVDEHLHLAYMAQVERDGRIQVPDPYTGKSERTALFSVDGLRSERGWQVGIVQIHQLTGASLPTLAHFLPALWAGYLGLGVWALLRPAPGALASAALTAILPTTVRFLGIGFLVPSAFGLVWVLAVVAVAHRAVGPGRLAALSLLVTGGFFIHIVPGTVALVAGLLTALMHRVPWRERVGLAAALLLPLLWILPAAWSDVTHAVTIRNGLPFEPQVFRQPGTGMLVAAVAGAGWAWLRLGDDRLLPHRVLSVVAALVLASLAWSLRQGHDNDATYGRLIPVLFLALAVLAGLGIGTLGTLAAAAASWRSRQAWRPLLAAGCILVIATPLLLVHPMGERLEVPYYRVFDDRSWQAATDAAAGGAGPGDVFLSHPWRAPVYNAVTGAWPATVLRPGAYPIHGELYEYYVASGGANATWLRDHGITVVIDELAPNAPYEQAGADVYRLVEP